MVCRSLVSTSGKPYTYFFYKKFNGASVTGDFSLFKKNGDVKNELAVNGLNEFVNNLIKEIADYAKGEFGSEVTAIPYDGFEFIKWSDGLTTPSRKDKSTYCFNVIDSARNHNVRYKGVYPLFAKQHTVYFRATSGGRIQGELIQTIATGKSSSELIAIADEGYIFMGWYLEDQYGLVYPGSFSNRITESNTLLYDPFEHGFPQTNSYLGQGYIVATFIEKRN